MYNVFDLMTIDLDSSYRNRANYPNPAQFETTFSSFPAPNAFQSTDPILNSYPYETDTSPAPISTTQVLLSPNSSTINNYYINSYITISGESRIITSYNGATQIATVSPAFTLAPSGPYTIRRALPSYSGIIGVGSTNTQYVFTANPPFDPTGYFISMTSGVLIGQVSLIQAYNFITKTATVATLYAAPSPGDTFEILQFTRDNFSPIITNIRKNGTPYTYEATLINLIVPNQTLHSGQGGTITNYPYVYVELRPKTNTTWFGIYSNNPNAKTAIFKVPVDTESVDSNFLVLENGRFMKQFFTFSNADSYIFSVYLPNGELVQFAPDNMSPLPPNPLLQISATFSLKLPATDYGSKIEPLKR